MAYGVPRILDSQPQRSSVLSLSALAAETRRNYAQDIALLLTFLWFMVQPD